MVLIDERSSSCSETHRSAAGKATLTPNTKLVAIKTTGYSTRTAARNKNLTDIAPHWHTYIYVSRPDERVNSMYEIIAK